MELPDGTEAWIPARSVERADDAVAVVRTAARCVVRDRPAPDAAMIAEIAPAKRLTVLGRFGAFRLVRADSVRGWTDCV